MYAMERVFRTLEYSCAFKNLSSSLMKSIVLFLVFIMFVNMYACLASNLGNQIKNHQSATEDQTKHLRDQKPKAIESDYPQLATLSYSSNDNTNSSFLDRLLSFHQNDHYNNNTQSSKEYYTNKPEAVVLNTPSTTTAASTLITTSPKPVEDDNRFYFNSELQPEETSTVPSTISLDEKDTRNHNISIIQTSTYIPMPKDETSLIDRLGNLFTSNNLSTTTELVPPLLSANNDTLQSLDNRLQFKNATLFDRIYNDTGIDQNKNMIQDSRNQFGSYPDSNQADLIQALRRLDFYENLRRIASQVHPNMIEPSADIFERIRQEISNSQSTQDSIIDLAASDSAPSDSSMTKTDSEIDMKKLKDKIFANEDSIENLKSKKATRVSLVSPYSAYFDHGFPPIRNMQINRASNQDGSLMNEPVMSNTSKPNRKLKSEKPKRVVDVANDGLNKKQRAIAKPVSVYSVSNNGIRVIKSYTSRKPIIKYPKSVNQNPPTTETNDLAESDKNFIRDERNANETIKKIIGEVSPATKIPEVSQFVTNDDEISNEFKDALNNMVNHSSQQLPRIWNINDSSTKHDINFLEDPYKKSLYYTDDYMSETMSLPYRPMLIRDLAKHHGVPLRLRSPFDDRFNFASPSSITEFKTTLDDSRIEDLSNLKTELDLEGLKFDDDLKQKSASKAIEAIAQEPDFFTRLQESLHSSENHLSPENMEQLHRLYLYLLRPNANLLPKTSPVASSNQINKLLPIQGSMNPIDFATSFSSSSKTAPTQNKLTGRKPVNLVVTDLVDKWALTRMPDLIPIPLAATVPGYLIRLPDGKILAAALTNSVTIQGIQNEPLNNGYKNFLNTKLKSLMKSNLQKNTNHLTSDSTLRNTVLPFNQLPSVQDSGRIKNSSSDIGLLRGVISHLGFGKGLNQRTNSTKDSARVKVNSNKLVKLTNSPFPIPPFTEQELASLSVASLNDPVFSFADDSQLLDQVYDPSLSRFPHYPYQHIQSLSSTIGSSILPMAGDSTDPMPSGSTTHHRYDQLSNLKSLLNGNLFINGERRGSKPRKFSSPLLWLIYKAARKLTQNLGTCNSVIGIPRVQQ